MSLETLRAPLELAGDRHGIRLRYLAGCRCLRCRMANSNYETARVRARAAGDWNGIVPADPARAHLHRLARAGVGSRAVAAAADLSRTIVREIGRGERVQARARTVRKILAVTPACRGDASLVPAAGTWQRIRLLLEEGFTKAELARRLGYKSPALQFRRELVLARTELAVARLYRMLTT